MLVSQANVPDFKMSGPISILGVVDNYRFKISQRFLLCLVEPRKLQNDNVAKDLKRTF